MPVTKICRVRIVCLNVIGRGRRDGSRGKDASDVVILGIKLDPNTKEEQKCASVAPANKPVHEILTKDLERLVSARKAEGNSEATIRFELITLHGAIKHAHKLGYKTNPHLQFPSVKKAKGRLKFLTREQEERLLEELQKPHVPQDNYDLVVTLLDTGARLSEITNLKWESVDLKNRRINLWRPKVQNESFIAITLRLFAILERRFKQKRDDQVYVLESSNHKPRSVYQRKAIMNAFKRAGLAGFTIHDLRHTHASKLIQNGVSLYEVAHQLGHSNPNHTTTIYAHLDSAKVGQKVGDVLNKLNAS